jgi:hypothetical protein
MVSKTPQLVFSLSFLIIESYQIMRVIFGTPDPLALPEKNGAVASSYNDCNWLTLSSPFSFVSPDHSGFTFVLIFRSNDVF